MVAHPNITVVDDGLTRDDIARLYSEEHAQVWELIQTAGRAASMKPPVFDAVALSASAGGHSLKAMGMSPVELGWLEVEQGELAKLRDELPEDPDALRRMGDGDGVVVEAVDVVETLAAAQPGLGPSDAIRLMRKLGIGRPSTYSRHVDNLFDAAEKGLLQVTETGSFRITAAGRQLLECLDERDLPPLDAEYCAEFERDLKAQEAGQLSAGHVLRTHLSRLPGVVVDIPDSGAAAVGRAATQLSPTAAVATSPMPASSALPVQIDPEVVLPRRHPLRALRAAFDRALADAYGAAQPNGQETSRRRAVRAAALGEVMGEADHDRVLDRVQLDLGWRWVAGLGTTDPVWSSAVFDNLVGGDGELRAALVQAGRAAMVVAPAKGA
jgi:hypothetical protein